MAHKKAIETDFEKYFSDDTKQNPGAKLGRRLRVLVAEGDMSSMAGDQGVAFGETAPLVALTATGNGVADYKQQSSDRQYRPCHEKTELKP